MSKRRSRFRPAEWLTALLLLPLIAGFAYLFTLGTLRLSLPDIDRSADVATPSPLPVIEMSGETVGWQKRSGATPTPAAAPLSAFNRWLEPTVGLSRANPYPRAEPVLLAHWRLQVLDQPIIRGDEAWQILSETDSANDPPGAGYEYVLVPLVVRHQRLTLHKKNLSLGMTGTQGVVYYALENSITLPQPALETYLPGQGESRGWQLFRVPAGEQKLQLVVADRSHYNEPNHYVALTEEESITVPEIALNAIAPTAIGRDPAEPARVGQTATTDNWQISVREVISGEAAWPRINAANQYNAPPPEGRAYYLLLVQIRYIGLAEGPHAADRYLFTVLGDDGMEYNPPALVPPQPDLSFDLFPGGGATGWMIVEVPVADEMPQLIFRPNPSVAEGERENDRYFAIREN